MPTMEGVVTLVQESRFQLIDDAGIGHLFILSSSAEAEVSQLALLRRQQFRVCVTYEASDDLLANIARSIARIAA